MNAPGMIVRPSGLGTKETMDRLASAVIARDMTIFARIDQAAAAEAAGLQLRPTEVLIFGNPRAGTLLMQASGPIAIELPLKVAVWEEAGQTWLAYSDPHWTAERHGLSTSLAPIVNAMRAGLAAICVEAVGSSATRST